MQPNTNHHIKNNQRGFTLIELMIAIAVMGVISIIAVRGLYDVVLMRAKQQTVEDTADSFRTITRTITKAVIESQNVYVPNNSEIRITGEKACQTYKFDASQKAILFYEIFPGPCTPPDPATSAAANITGNDIEITSLIFSPVNSASNVIVMQIEGVYKNSLGDHPIKYETTMTPRI